MRSLLVGDIHATPEELDDCKSLMDFVEQSADALEVDEVCFMGDQHHTHNIIRAEVMAFYRERFKAWRTKPWRRKALVGNHDYAGEGHPVHAMMIYEDLIEVIDRPVLEAGRLYLPYYADREQFLVDAKLGGHTLICHQTFDGSVYENGFYAQDGVLPELVPQEWIISGHIHTPQEFGKVKYIGAPRWRSLNDANLDRHLWIYSFDGDGRVVSKDSISTNDVCRQIRYVIDTPDAMFEAPLDAKSDWRIDVKGPTAFVEERKKFWAFQGAKTRTFPTDNAVVRVRESEGIDIAFRSYLEQFKPKNGTAADRLARMAQERLHV